MTVGHPMSHGRGDGRDFFLLVGLTLTITIFVNTSLSYVPTSYPGLSLVAAGRALFWSTLVLSIVASATHDFRTAIMVVMITCTMLLFRSLSIVNPSAPAYVIGYRLSYSLIIAIAASSLYIRAGRWFDKWVRFVVYISGPVLLLQVLGTSETVHFVNTLAMNNARVVDIDLARTFLVGFDQLTANFTQLRPPGLFYSNSIAAIFAVFAIAYRFGKPMRDVSIYDVFLIYMTLLLMAKVAMVFLVVAIVIRYIISKGRVEVSAAKRFALMTVGLFILHWLLFPGVVEDRLSVRSLYVSVAIRLVDFLLSLNIDAIPSLGIGLLEYSELNLRVTYDGQPVGGYSGLPFLTLISPLLLWAWLRLVRARRKGRVSTEDLIRSGFLFLGLVLVFMTSPVLGAPLIPFLFGPALVPMMRIQSSLPPRQTGLAGERTRPPPQTPGGRLSASRRPPEHGDG